MPWRAIRWLNPDDAGNTAAMQAIITRLDPPYLLETRADLHGTLRWQLRPEGDGTELTFTSTTQLPPEFHSRVLAGWHWHLDALGQILAGGRVDLVHLPDAHWTDLNQRYAATLPA